MFRRSSLRAPAWLLGGALFLLPLVVAAIGALRHPALDHGDKYSDANVLIAARAFALEGSGRNSGLAVQQTYFPPGARVLPYTHYPPGPEWAHLGWRSLGIRELPGLRLASVAIAALAAFLAHRLFRAIAGEPVGTLAAMAYVWSLPFLTYADSLHQHPYAMAGLALTLWAWLRYERAPPEDRGWALALTAVASFADGWFSFENIPLVAVFVVGRAVSRRDLRRGALLICLVPFLLVGARVAHNATVLGLRGAVGDLVGSDRIDGYDPGLADLWEAWAPRLGARDLALDHHDMEARLPLLVRWVAVPTLALLAWLARPIRDRDRLHSAAIAAVLLLLGAAAWTLVSVTHAVLHPHLGRLLLPGAALLVGAALAAGVSAAASERRPLARAVAVLLCATLAAGWGWQTVVSFAFARGWPLAHPAQGLMAERHAVQSRTAALAAATEGRQAVVVFGNYPYVAATLPAPWEPAEARARRLGQPADAVPEIAAHEALWFEAWSDLERARALEASRKLGFPDVPGAGSEPSLLFWGEGRSGRPLPVAFDGLALEAARTARAADGGTVFQVRAGPATEAFLELRCDGAPGQRLGDAAGAVYWFALAPGDAGEPRRRLSVWDEAAGQPRPVRAGAALPPGVSIGASGTWIEVDLRAFAGDPASRLSR